MGTTFAITVYAPDADTAEAALAAAFARIDELDGRLSDYDSQSELSRLSDHPVDTAIPVSDDLWEVLVVAALIAEQSEGAFDITVGPLSRLWRRARRQGRAPSPERLTHARRATGAQLLSLEPRERTVRLRATGMRLDLGGIAKGFALDEALDVLTERGLPQALVDGGGDVALGEPPPGREAWLVAVEATGESSEPRPRLALARAAVATSGDRYRRALVAGRRSSHILDPRTGLGLPAAISATVVAPSGVLADALASALCVLGPERGLALVDSLSGVEARVTTGEGARLRTTESIGFAALVLSSRSTPKNTHGPPTARDE
ncbi:MAG: FAD:protein FMN transferase [Planctomycetota bacterium]|jgi:thiamine biosynthesis lipoprotein|nr:FAD:protein FMN transferase [Planctomycetota bacterium]